MAVETISTRLSSGQGYGCCKLKSSAGRYQGVEQRGRGGLQLHVPAGPEAGAWPRPTCRPEQPLSCNEHPAALEATR